MRRHRTRNIIHGLLMLSPRQRTYFSHLPWLAELRNRVLYRLVQTQDVCSGPILIIEYVLMAME